MASLLLRAGRYTARAAQSSALYSSVASRSQEQIGLSEKCKEDAAQSGHSQPNICIPRYQLPNYSGRIPVSIDWRDHGVVTDVSHQGKCGSCWAYAATASVESLNAIQGNNLLKLSEQQLIDCVDLSCYGCDGGDTVPAFEYIIANEGQVNYEAYPSAWKQQSPKEVTAEGVTISGFDYFYDMSDLDLMRLVSAHPVNAVIGADLCFTEYKEGVISGPAYTLDEMEDFEDPEKEDEKEEDAEEGQDDFEDPEKEDEKEEDAEEGQDEIADKKKHTGIQHCVTIIGYNYQHGFWIIKNSWRNQWGHYGGFAFISMNGSFGVNRDISYPIKQCPNKIVSVRPESKLLFP